MKIKDYISSVEMAHNMPAGFIKDNIAIILTYIKIKKISSMLEDEEMLEATNIEFIEKQILAALNFYYPSVDVNKSIQIAVNAISGLSSLDQNIISTHTALVESFAFSCSLN